MVQRKAPNKVGSQSEPKKKNLVKSEKRFSSHQHQDTRNRGGGDLKKKMRKARSINVSDLGDLGELQFEKPSPHKKPSPIKISDGSPNYMKPTSSSDARKERLQVSVQSPISTDKNRGPRRNSNKPSCSSPGGSGLKPSKTLTRKSSLKPVRASMKKSTQSALHPKLNVNRATCSTTLKDSKFPNALDLNPGANESEGTSVMKVCPYTYCSLNGHRHAPLPPLKCFLSARRRLLKTQKSMKLKGLSSFRGAGSGKGEKEIDTRQVGLRRAPSGLEIIPLIEEVGNDFFVEIYATSQTQAVESMSCDEGSFQEKDGAETPQVSNEVSVMGDDGEGAKIELEDDDGRVPVSQIDESYSEISLDDNLDQNSDISIEDMDVLMDFLEYIECDQQVEAEDEENLPCLVPENYVEWSYECCLVNVLGTNSEGFAESEANKSPSEATDMNWEEESCRYPDNKTDYSEYPVDESDLIYTSLPGNENPSDEVSFESDNVSITCEKAGADTELPHGVYDEVAEIGETMAFEGGSSGSNDVGIDDGEERLEINEPLSCIDNSSYMSNSLIESQLTDVSDVNSQPLEPESSEENDQGDLLRIEGSDALNRKVNSDSCHLDSEEDDAFEEPEEGHALPEQGEVNASEILQDEASELDNLATCNESPDHIILSKVEEEESGNEVQIASCLFKIQFSDSHQTFTETDQDITDNDHIQDDMEIEVSKCDDATEGSSIPSYIHNCSYDDQLDKSNSEGNEGKSGNDQLEEFSETEGSKSESIEAECIETNGTAQMKDHVLSDADEPCLVPSIESPEEDKTINTAAIDSDEPDSDASSELKARTNITRKRKTEDLEELKEFNPRAPRFLPVEPDPEAEKVDLRHQMMEERKNAEEWMIDYALQQAVTKLAPARKRKVALLVEAFETVVPLPMCEKPLRHATAGFAHARPIQACN